MIDVKPYWNLNVITLVSFAINITIDVKPYWNLNMKDFDGDFIDDSIDVKPYWNLNKLPKLVFVGDTKLM